MKIVGAPPPHILGWGGGSGYTFIWHLLKITLSKFESSPMIFDPQNNLFSLFFNRGGYLCGSLGHHFTIGFGYFFFFISTRPPLQDIKKNFFSFISKILINLIQTVTLTLLNFSIFLLFQFFSFFSIFSNFDLPEKNPIQFFFPIYYICSILMHTLHSSQS